MALLKLDHGARKEICPHCDALIGQAVDQRVEASLQDGIKLAMENWQPSPTIIREAVRVSNIWGAEVEKLLEARFNQVRQEIAVKIAKLAKDQVLAMAQETVAKVLKQNAPKVASFAPVIIATAKKTQMESFSDPLFLVTL